MVTTPKTGIDCKLLEGQEKLDIVNLVDATKHFPLSLKKKKTFAFLCQNMRHSIQTQSVGE
jgi:hypothetical protein